MLHCSASDSLSTFLQRFLISFKHPFCRALQAVDVKFATYVCYSSVVQLSHSIHILATDPREFVSFVFMWSIIITFFYTKAAQASSIIMLLLGRMSLIISPLFAEAFIIMFLVPSFHFLFPFLLVFLHFLNSLKSNLRQLNVSINEDSFLSF